MTRDAFVYGDSRGNVGDGFLELFSFKIAQTIKIDSGLRDFALIIQRTDDAGCGFLIRDLFKGNRIKFDVRKISGEFIIFFNDSVRKDHCFILVLINNAVDQLGHIDVFRFFYTIDKTTVQLIIIFSLTQLYFTCHINEHLTYANSKLIIFGGIGITNPVTLNKHDAQ